MIYLESRGKRYSNCSMSLKWNDKNYEFNSTGAKDLYRDIIDWLYKTGYTFSGSYHTNPTRKIHTTEEVKQKISSTAYSLKDFHNILDTDKWIMCATPIKELFSGLIKMLKLHSVESIKTVGLDLEDIDDSKIEPEIVSSGDELEFDTEGESQYSDEDLSILLTETLSRNLRVIPWFIKFLKILLSENLQFNREEIISEFLRLGVDDTPGKCGEKLNKVSQFLTKPNNEHLRQIISYDTIRWSISAETDTGSKKDNYKIKDEYRNLVRDVLKNFDDEVVKYHNFVSSSKSVIPNYTTTQPVVATEPEIQKFGYIYSSPVSKETEASEPKKGHVTNPFMQAICILGSSGKGKSTTIDKMLTAMEKTYSMIYDFIIPTASTTGLLSQFSPAAKDGKGGYIPSRLGKMIMDAHNNPDKLFTAVFDECHKASIIEMINDELLQCISKNRNLGKRFISLDTETQSLFTGLEDFRGNLLLPNNFGFIFLSSKPDVILDNDDFFNRVDIYVMIKQPKESQSCEDIINNTEFFKKFDEHRKSKSEIKETFESTKDYE